MRAVVHSFRVCEVVYFNCRGCGAPIFTEKERALGWCGCGRKKKKKSKVTMRELKKVFDAYDPYGQPRKTGLPHNAGLPVAGER